MDKKILCATDGSHSAEKAVDYAVSLAKAMGAELTFITVNVLTDDDIAHTHFWDSTMLEAANAQLEQELLDAKNKAQQQGLSEVSCARVQGHNIAASIIAFAEGNGYDHIVTGSVGRTGVARMLLGSIAENVITKAHCPVTVVR